MSASRSNSSSKKSSSSSKKKTTSKKQVKKSTPKKSTPKKSTPKKSTPKKSTPKKSTPKKSTPKKTTKKKSTPKKTTPKKTTSKKTTAKKSNASTTKKTTAKKSNASTTKKTTAKKSNASTKKKTTAKKSNASTKKKTATKKSTEMKKLGSVTKKSSATKKSNASTTKKTTAKKSNASTTKKTAAKKTTEMKKLGSVTKKSSATKKTNASTKKVTGSNISKGLTPIARKSKSNNSTSFKYNPTAGRNIQTTQDKASRALIDLKKVANILYGMSNKAANGIISTIERLQKNINRANSNLSVNATKVSKAGSNVQNQIRNIVKGAGSNIKLNFGSNHSSAGGNSSLKYRTLPSMRKSNISYTEITKHSGAYGRSYEELDNMKYSQLVELLGKKALETPVLQNLEEPLDATDTEISEELRTMNMFHYRYRIVNSYHNEDSVCEGAAYWDKDTIVYCDVNTKTEQGQIRFMRRNEIYDSKKGRYDRTASELSHMEVEGHSNDITVIPEENKILHINNKNNTIEVYKVDKNYNLVKTKTISNIKANGIAYDKKTKEVVIIHGTDAEYYSKDNFVNSKSKPKPKEKFKITDKVKDKDNSAYYNYVQGIAAEDGMLYISYSGFNSDKNKYGGKDDKVIGNMIVTYDYKNGGKAVGRINDNVKVEIEGFDFDENGNLVAFYNGGHWTRVFDTDLVNSKDISEKYKSS